MDISKLSKEEKAELLRKLKEEEKTENKEEKSVFYCIFAAHIKTINL